MREKRRIIKQVGISFGCFFNNKNSIYNNYRIQFEKTTDVTFSVVQLMQPSVFWSMCEQVLHILHLPLPTTSLVGT